MKKSLFILVLLLAGTASYAQFEKGQFLLHTIIVGTDTMPYISLQTVEIVATGKHWTTEDIDKYNRLKRKVIKVYPYAKFAKDKFEEINRISLTISARDRKKYIKDEEHKAKLQFEGQLKQLTYSEGKILIKLIDRETGETSYQVVKELRGTFQAFFWQSLARLFGANLKAEYDSTGEDKMIEQIMRGIESRQIPVK